MWVNIVFTYCRLRTGDRSSWMGPLSLTSCWNRIEGTPISRSFFVLISLRFVCRVHVRVDVSFKTNAFFNINADFTRPLSYRRALTLLVNTKYVHLYHITMTLTCCVVEGCTLLLFTGLACAFSWCCDSTTSSALCFRLSERSWCLELTLDVVIAYFPFQKDVLLFFLAF